MGGNFSNRNFEVGKEMHAPTGGIMTSSEEGRYGALEIDDVKERGIRRDLLYAGKSGSTIRISYREFAFYKGSTLARPGYSRELTYDLSESAVITFDDLKIEVLSATNNEIIFKVK